MSTPDEIRAQIEDTRADLSTNVDALSDKVNPSSIVHRRTEKAKGAVNSVRDKVMGGGSNAGGTVSDKASQLSGAADSAPSAVADKAKGNPFAAGIIAFGAGWLISSLLPASQKEQDLAATAKDKVSEHSDQLTAPLKEIQSNVQDQAKDAVQSVKGTAQDAADTVKDQAQSAKGDVTDQAKQAKDQVNS